MYWQLPVIWPLLNPQPYIHQILNANSVIEFLNKILVQAQEDDYFSLNPTIPESEQNLFE